MKSLSIFYKGMLFSIIIVALYSEIFVNGTIVKGAFLYFTIQSNILVALCLLALVFIPMKERGKCLTRGVSLLAIIITGLVYNFLLHQIFSDWGTAVYTFSRTVTHVIAPVGFIVDWLVFDKHGIMKPKDILIWLIYPLVYYLIMFYMSYRYGFSVYFFINYNSGYRSILQWFCFFLVAVVLISFIFIGIDLVIGRIAKRR